MDPQQPNPYTGSWEGPWEGRNPFWMYPLQGQARLEIAADGAVAAEISISPGGERSRWQGQMQVTGEIELEALRAGSAEGQAHGEGEILPSGRLRVTLLVGGLRPVPFEAEFELTQRRGPGRDEGRGARTKQGFLQSWRERLKLRRLLRILCLTAHSAAQVPPQLLNRHQAHLAGLVLPPRRLPSPAYRWATSSVNDRTRSSSLVGRS